MYKYIESSSPTCKREEKRTINRGLCVNFNHFFFKLPRKNYHGDETWSAKEAILETSICGNAVSCG